VDCTAFTVEPAEQSPAKPGRPRKAVDADQVEDHALKKTSAAEQVRQAQEARQRATREAAEQVRQAQADQEQAEKPTKGTPLRERDTWAFGEVGLSRAPGKQPGSRRACAERDRWFPPSHS